MDWLLNEAKATGEHTLKRTLGPVSLTALGVGAIIGAGIFVLSGLGAHYAGPGLMLSFVISGFGCAFAGLCYAEFAALIPLAGSAYTYAYAALGELFAWIIGWDLTLEYAMGASTVSSGWSNHFIEFLDIFGIEHAALARLRSLDRASHRGKHRRPADGFASDSGLALGSQAFLARVGDIIAAQSPELIQRAHDLVNAPHLFGMEIGFNLPAFLIALIITAILVRGIQESASFNAVIVIIKVAVVLFVIGLGIHYINFSNWGHDWATFAPMGFCGIGAGAAYIFFAYIGFDAVSTTAQEAKNPATRSPHRHHRVAPGLHGSLHSRCRRSHRDGPLEGNQHRSSAGRRFPRPRTHKSFLPDHPRRACRPHQRDARHASRPDARSILHGQRRPSPAQILRGHPSEIPHAVQKHNPSRLSRCDRGQHSPN